MKHIVFSGIDGSGKTTKAMFSLLFLSRMGIRSYYIWFRWNAYVSYLALLIARITGLTVRKKVCGQVILVREYYKNKVLARLWIITQFTDFLIGYVFHALRARLNGAQIVIYDRFIVPDKVVDLIYETRTNVIRNIIAKALIYYFISRIRSGNMIIIFNKISSKKVLILRRDIPSSSYPFIYERFYKKVLKLLSNVQGLYVLDAEKGLKENLSILKRILNGFCDKKKRK